MNGDAYKPDALWPKGGALEIPDEYRMLLLCARTRVEPQQRELIRELALKQLDWEFIRRKAQPHALIPLLYRNLSKFCADRVPPAVLQQLQSDNLANAERNRANTAELIRVLRILKAAGIDTVAYKGPALAAVAHGDIELRRFWDLDILVRPHDVLSAKSLLLAEGYEWNVLKGQVTGRNEARNFSIGNEYEFIHTVNNARIDLHWRISARRFPFEVDLDEIWKRLQRVRLLDEDIQTFPPEALLVFLCVHGSKDMWWKRIGWTCDIAELLASNPDFDWSYTFDLATRTGARRMLLLGLALAHELLQAELPEQVCARIRSDNSVQTLFEYVRHRMFDAPDAWDPILERQRFHSKVRERLRDRLPIYRNMAKVALTFAVTPNSKDRELVKLPAYLSALYYLVRPARIIHRLWSLGIRGGNPTL